MKLSERIRSLVLAIHRADPKADEWRAHIRQLARETATLEGILRVIRSPEAENSALIRAKRRIDALQEALDEAAAVIDDLLLSTSRLWRLIEATHGVDWRAVESALGQAGQAHHVLPLRRLLRTATDAAAALPDDRAEPRNSPTGASA